MEKIIIQGNYHLKPVDVYFTKSRQRTSKVTVFVQGLFGVFEPNDQEDKINLLVKKLTEEGVSHCVNYNSSRDFSYDSQADFNYRMEAFKEKTFEEELGDLKSVVKWVIDNSSEIFGITKEELKLNICGSSLGGTLAVLLEEHFPIIEKISLAGSGCGTNGSTKPILSTHYPEKDILDAVSTFKGKLLLIQGGEDTTVPLESGRKIIENASSASVSHIIIPGANHNFSKLNGEKSTKVKEEFVQALFDFFKPFSK